MPKAKPAPAMIAVAEAEPATLRLVPLAVLTLSPFNARQEVDQTEIDAMAESLSLAGLLQNLVGHEDAAGEIGIVGGGKRLRALQQLAAEGWTRCAAIDPVPVKVTRDPALAVQWAGTENTAREALSPADEITAFAALRAQGSTPDVIARTFAVTGSYVARRLALADLPEAVIANLRAGRISLDVAKALTLAQSPRRAVEVLEMALAQKWSAHNVRHALTQGAVRSYDKRIKFVTLAALEAAGAVVNRDLFEDDVYVSDVALLDRLFLEKGGALASGKAATEGWSWSEFWPKDIYEYKTAGLATIWPEKIELPEGDLARLEELSETEGLNTIEQAELDALEARCKGDFTDEQRQVGGVVITVTHDGSPGFHYYARKTALSQGGEGGAGSSAGKAQVAKPLPESLLADLKRIKLLSLQTALMGNASLMLDLLGWQLISDMPSYNAPLGLTATLPEIRPEKPEGTTVADDFAKPPRDYGPPEASFAAWLAKPQEDRVAILGRCLARLFRCGDQDSVARLLAGQLAVNPRDVWTPTAAGYFSRIPGPALDALYVQLVPVTVADHKAFKALKKGPKVEALADLFGPQKHAIRAALQLTPDDDVRLDAWLPPELQWAAPAAPADAAPAEDAGDAEDDEGAGDLDEPAGDAADDEAEAAA